MKRQTTLKEEKAAQAVTKEKIVSKAVPTPSF